MDIDLFTFGRFALGLALIGGVYLWLQQMRTREKLPAAITGFLDRRLHYLLVGVIFGYTTLPDLQVSFSDSARLIIPFLSGWFGMVVGLSFDVRGLRRSSIVPLYFDIGRAGGAIFLVIVATEVCVQFTGGGWLPQQTATLCILSGVCAVSLPVNPSILGERAKGNRRGGQLALAAGCGILLASLGSTSLQGVPFHIDVPFAPTTKSILADTLAKQIAWGLVLGGMVGVILDLLIRGAERVEIFFLMGGGIALGCGIAMVLGLSPLWVGMIAGIWLINSTLHRLDLLEVVNRSRGILKIGLYFSTGWLLGEGLELKQFAPVAFAWGIIVVLLCRPVGFYIGTRVVVRLLGADKGRGRELTRIPELEDIALVIGTSLLWVPERGTGLPLLAGIAVGQWMLFAVGRWHARENEKAGERDRRSLAPPQTS